jgi:hypothetical protein
LNSTSEAHPNRLGNASGQWSQFNGSSFSLWRRGSAEGLKINTPTVEEPMEFIFQGIKISAMIKETI